MGKLKLCLKLNENKLDVSFFRSIVKIKNPIILELLFIKSNFRINLIYCADEEKFFNAGFV